MTDKKHTSAAADDQSGQPDELDRIVAVALANQALPLEDELGAEEAAQALTDDDRQALAALGSPRDLVRRISALMARQHPTVVIDDSEASTCYAEPDETVPRQGYLTGSGDALDFAELTSRFQSVQEPEPPIEFTSRYRKVRKLGRGGQGVVYLTECLEELSGEQALKVFSPLPYRNGDGYREDMQRLLQVASLVHRIHHDNVVDVQRFSNDHGIYMMVMQWIDGYDLRQLLDPQLVNKLRQVAPAVWSDRDNVIYASPSPGRVCLQPLLAIYVIEKGLRGLSALHEKGIVHADIKPSNIMLDCNGSIRIIDIGSAFRFATPPSQRNWTPRYAPPEFLEHGIWTPQSDLASLGYVLIELLGGGHGLGGPDMGAESTRTCDRQRNQQWLTAKRTLPQRLHELLPANVRRCDKLVQLCRKLIDPVLEKRFAKANLAIELDFDSTWNVRKDIVKGDLAVHESSAIQRWITAVKQAYANLGGVGQSNFGT